MAISAIEGVLWPGCKALAPSVSLLGGITVNKGGYHSTRNWLRANKPNDYSIQHPNDKLGPGDEGSALDWTFADAQRSDFSTIAKFSRRLYEAGVRKDPRAYPLREFYGNIDSDRDVEGWSYYRDRAGSSDSSHLWHIHFSVWRKYINDEAAMRSILSILSGEEEGDDDMALTNEDAIRVHTYDSRIWNTEEVAVIDGRTPAEVLELILQKVGSIDARLAVLESRSDPSIPVE